MSEFDYRKFLAENKLTKVSRGRETGKAKILSEGIQIREGFDMDVDTEMDEANAQKDAYFKRKEREKRGNWGGSVGAFVEKHGEDLGRVGTNRQALVNYIETTMKPELNDEAKAYVDNLVATTKSSFKLLQALYNATMAGSGLSTGAGSLREEDWEGDDSLYESVTVSKKYPQEKGSRTSVTSRKYKGKKAGDGQDRMAKSEMTGEKMDVTIGGVTKSISTRAYNKYRKMTDPEEKKAWKKKYGFISEGRVSRDRKRLLKESTDPEFIHQLHKTVEGRWDLGDIETYDEIKDWLTDPETDVQRLEINQQPVSNVRAALQNFKPGARYLVVDPDTFADIAEAMGMSEREFENKMEEIDDSVLVTDMTGMSEYIELPGPGFRV